MTHLEFLRDASTVALLERAGLSAGVPLSIHYVKRSQEGTRVCGWGQCDACRVVSTVTGGANACRLSRTTASAMAIQQQRPITYLCHMGFACVALAPFSDEGYVITLGPYCPMEEQRSLVEDVRMGLAALNEEGDSLPDYSLDDIHCAPASAVPAVAAWLLEAIGAAWMLAQTPRSESVGDGPVEVEGPVRRGGVGAKNRPRARITTTAQELAAALSGESHAQARAILKSQLEELGPWNSRTQTVYHARTATLVVATMEALGRAGISVEAAWPLHERFVRRLPTLVTERTLLDEAIRVFSFLRRKEERIERAEGLPNYPELYALVKDRLLEGVTLDEVASRLGETPSAISHRLKRKFGMSFSEYVGRIRIDMAKQYLRRTGLSATDVAHRVGIADQSNFSKLFRKLEGVSPSSYRKSHGKE